jgi:small subunit ribosomal protein S21
MRVARGTAPRQRAVLADQLDGWVNQNGGIGGGVLGVARLPPAGNAEDEEPQRLIDLRGGKTDAGCVLHGFDHVGDQTADLRGTRIGHRGAFLQQNRVAHPGDFQNGHVRVVPLLAENGLVSIHDHVIAPAPASESLATDVFAHPMSGAPWIGAGGQVQVLVRDNNVDQALKALKKKMQREGIFREMKLRRHYEKPSERRAREAAEAVRRARKLERKRLEREGF